MAMLDQHDPRTMAIAASLSEPRLGPYLKATQQHLKDALRLYQWNVDLSGAVYEALHVVEVVLRNAMDAQISLWNATQVHHETGAAHTSDWLVDPARLLIRLVGNDITEATRRARKACRTGQAGGRIPGHPDIVAQLTLGTWRFLLPDKDPGRQLLWADGLHRAFPHHSGTSAGLVDHLRGIHLLRNRVAHLEPLLRAGLVDRHFRQMRAVVGAVDPLVETWFTSRQRITATLRSRPSMSRSTTPAAPSPDA